MCIRDSLIDGHVAALIGDLGGHDDSLSKACPPGDGAVVIPVLVGRQAAYPKGFYDCLLYTSRCV